VAPVLVCPECSTKHPLGNIGDRTAFPCEGCGRTLKVPAAAMAAVPSAPAATVATPRVSAPPEPRPAVPESATHVLPLTEPLAEPPPPMPRAVEPDAPPTRSPVPPAWIRFLLWIVAIPLAFAVVFGFARATGMLTTNQISDVALAEGWGRFWPIARLIPFVAVAAAAFVQGSAWLIVRLRERRWAEQARHAGPPHTNGAGPRRPPSRSRSQSTRTRA